MEIRMTPDPEAWQKIAENCLNLFRETLYDWGIIVIIGIIVTGIITTIICSYITAKITRKVLMDKIIKELGMIDWIEINQRKNTIH